MTGSVTQQRLPSVSAKELETFARYLVALTSITPPRTSARQMLAFCMVAQAHIRNQSLNMADLMNAVGDDARGVSILGRSIERTFGLFMEPTRANPDGLAWVTQVLDEDDRRKKYLRLTDLGAHAVRVITGMDE
jgi:hypothetical protein